MHLVLTAMLSTVGNLTGLSRLLDSNGWLGSLVVRASDSWSSDHEFDSAGALPGSLGQLKVNSAFHPLRGSLVGKSSTRLPSCRLGLRRGEFTCVGWQLVTLCDPIWQVTSRSSRTSSRRGLYSALTFNDPMSETLCRWGWHLSGSSAGISKAGSLENHIRRTLSFDPARNFNCFIFNYLTFNLKVALLLK